MVFGSMSWSLFSPGRCYSSTVTSWHEWGWIFITVLVPSLATEIFSQQNTGSFAASDECCYSYINHWNSTYSISIDYIVFKKWMQPKHFETQKHFFFLLQYLKIFHIQQLYISWAIATIIKYSTYGRCVFADEHWKWLKLNSLESKLFPMFCQRKKSASSVLKVKSYFWLAQIALGINFIFYKV